MKKESSFPLLGFFCVLLSLVFITLKLCKVIDWSWLWVLAPLWIPIAIGTAILFIVFLVILIIKIVQAVKKQSKQRKED